MPGLFSTTTDWPYFLASRVPIARARTSAVAARHEGSHDLDGACGNAVIREREGGGERTREDE